MRLLNYTLSIALVLYATFILVPHIAFADTCESIGTPGKGEQYLLNGTPVSYCNGENVVNIHTSSSSQTTHVNAPVQQKPAVTVIVVTATPALTPTPVPQRVVQTVRTYTLPTLTPTASPTASLIPTLSPTRAVKATAAKPHPSISFFQQMGRQLHGFFSFLTRFI